MEKVCHQLYAPIPGCALFPSESETALAEMDSQRDRRWLLGRKREGKSLSILAFYFPVSKN